MRELIVSYFTSTHEIIFIIRMCERGDSCNHDLFVNWPLAPSSAWLLYSYELWTRGDLVGGIRGRKAPALFFFSITAYKTYQFLLEVLRSFQSSTAVCMTGFDLVQLLQDLKNATIQNMTIIK